METTFDEISEAWEPRGVSPLQTARDITANIRPPAGRAELTIPAQLALAQTLATIALAEAQETQNALLALQLGVPALEHDDKVSTVPKTEERRQVRNRLRVVVRRGLGL